MAEYKFRGILKDGKIVRNKMNAANKREVVKALKEANIQPVIVKRMNSIKINRSKEVLSKKDFERFKKTDKKSLGAKKITDMTLKDLKREGFNIFRRVKTKDIIVFVNDLYILKKAGFNNINALESIYEGTDNPVFKDIIENLLIGVESVERIHTLMEGYPNIFPAMFVNFIRVGEESGTLEQALIHGRDYVEESAKLRKQIRAAVVPKVLQFVGIMVMLFATLLVGVPILENIYGMFGTADRIPKATLIAVNVTKWIVKYWYIIVGIIAGIIGTFITYYNTPLGRYKVDKMLLYFPVTGALTTSIIVNKFFQAMLLNLRNGLRIQESLEVSKSITTNYYFLSLIEVAKNKSLAGESWIEPFETTNIFKPMVSQMVSIGMKTDLSEMMSKVNEYLKSEIDESISKFVKTLPEISYLFVGIALIIFVWTVMVPLMEVYMGSFIQM